jgi:hypothetical protein
MERQNLVRVILYISTIFIFICFFFLIKKYLLPPIDGKTKLVDLILSLEAIIAALIATAWIWKEIVKQADRVYKILSASTTSDSHEHSDFIENAKNAGLIMLCVLASAAIYVWMDTYAQEKTLQSIQSDADR